MINMDQAMKMVCRLSIFFALCWFVTGCTSLSQQEANWPTHIPPISFFQDNYAKDINLHEVQTEENYLVWVKRFYLGWVLYPNGWDWLTQNVLRQTPDEEQSVIKSRMASLGERVCVEWAKDSDNRKVNSSHLMIWGNALKLAIKRSEQGALTAKISEDVSKLLSQTLPPSEINFERYFPEPGTSLAKETPQDDPFDDV